MNAAREALAREKEHLLQRSQLARLQLRRETRGLRDALHWKRGAYAAGRNPWTRRIALGVVLSLAGAGRTARIVKFAARALVAARLARALFAAVRAR
jgi:hypothetical protein